MNRTIRTMATMPLGVLGSAPIRALVVLLTVISWDPATIAITGIGVINRTTANLGRTGICLDPLRCAVHLEEVHAASLRVRRGRAHIIHVERDVRAGGCHREVLHQEEDEGGYKDLRHEAKKVPKRTGSADGPGPRRPLEDGFLWRL